MSLRVGVDTGGTFSDFVLLDEDSGQVWTAKVPSTPADPAQAVEQGLRELIAQAPGVVDRVVVGTTVATNAVIERKGPRVVYVTNEGFTDVPFIGRLDKERLYDLHWRKPKPLVHRRDCVGVGGRIAFDGSEVEALDGDELDRLEDSLRALANGDSGDLAVAVCLLFSYVEPDHERRVAERIRAALPAAATSISHEVSPIWREYERASTTIADAFVKSRIEDYVEGVGRVVHDTVAAGRWNLLASNGGYLQADQARHRPAQLLLSGLAGGVIGAAFHARACGHESVFSLDMGGTSCDLGLVIDGEQQYATEFNLAFGLPVSIPCVAVTTIGAGGGSIGWVDRGGLLHVGPQSAGADPGPAAYGHGGTEPTVTDANLVLGRLDADYFLGGAVPLDADAGTEAVARLGEQLQLDEVEAAQAMLRTADENMANAIRLIAVERGLDPRDFALIAFGGAGPLHARAVAQRLDMRTVLVPPRPGLCSAFGATIAQARVDRMRTFSRRSTDADLTPLSVAERSLRDETIAELRRSVDVDDPTLVRTAGMRYEGQNYELEVTLPDGDIDAGSWATLLQRFEDEHRAQYGFALPGEAVELINLRVTAFLPEEPPRVGAASASGRAPASRPVYFDDGAVDCPIVPRGELVAGASLPGPVIVEDPDSTTLVWPGDEVVLVAGGTLQITLGDDS